MLFNLPHDVGAESLMTLVTQAGHVSWYAVTLFCNKHFDCHAAKISRHWQEDLDNRDTDRTSRRLSRPTTFARHVFHQELGINT